MRERKSQDPSLPSCLFYEVHTHTHTVYDLACVRARDLMRKVENNPSLLVSTTWYNTLSLTHTHTHTHTLYIINLLIVQNDLKQFGSERGWCPYFLARYAVSHYLTPFNPPSPLPPPPLSLPPLLAR